MSIVAAELCKCFDGHFAVDHLSFRVAAGEIYGLIGPNGAGKTTLFNCIAGLHTVTAGRIVFDGEDITQFLDLDQAFRPNLEQRRVNLDLPNWMISTLDREAKRVGVTRQSIMKVWISERIKAEQTS